jgi:hypothetical protein
MKWITMLLMLAAFAAVNVGCEAEADDDGASIKVDGD